MSKQKTRKTWAKRLKTTKTGKLLKRHAGQDHFNARATGKTTRRKRTDKTASGAIHRAAKVQMPHN